MDNQIIDPETAPVEETAAPVAAEVKRPSSFRFALGALLAFFGISSKTHRASKKRAKLVGDIVTYIVLLFGAFLMVYPFWWMLAGSFAYTAPGNVGIKYVLKLVWWPEVSTFNYNSMYDSTSPGYLECTSVFFNYVKIFTDGFSTGVFAGIEGGFSYWRALLNNLIYSVVPVVVGVITSASAAFAFAKIQWIGRNAVFFFLLAAVMVPGPAIMTTQYSMYAELNMLNAAALIVPGLFGSIMTAFFIRQFLFGMPTSIIEAAKIDGAGYFRIFCGFVLPLAMPAIMAQGLLSFMGCWNNYMGSYIFIPENTAWINLPHAMQMLNDSIGDTNLGPIIASSVVCVLPVIILFGCFQKLIIGSLMLTGSKE